MKDITPEERWTVWFTQAERFAAKDNFADAVARVESCIAQIEEALRGETDPERRTRLTQLRAKAVSMKTSFRQSYERMNKEIYNRRMRDIANADDEMKRPLPLPKDFR